VVGAAIGQAMNEPWIAVISEDDRFCPLVKERIEVGIGQAVGDVSERGLQRHDVKRC